MSEETSLVAFRADGGQTSSSGQSRKQPAPAHAQPEDLHHEVTIGEGDGVGGSAKVERKRKGSDELFKPDCTVEPREEEVYVRCTFDTRGERYEFEGGVRVKLDPDGS